MKISQNFTNYKTSMLNQKSTSFCAKPIDLVMKPDATVEIAIDAAECAKRISEKIIGKPTKSVALATFDVDNFHGKLSDKVTKACKKHGINPTDDLFVISVLNKDNKRCLMFNSFFYDNVNRKDKMQVFELISRNDELSDMQTDVYKIFYDKSGVENLKKGSITNPLACISEIETLNNTTFLDRISGWAKQTDGIPVEKMMYDENKTIKPIIYSADGTEIRRLHTTLENLKKLDMLI